MLTTTRPEQADAARADLARLVASRLASTPPHYRYSMVIGLAYNGWLGVLVATRLGTGLAWAATALIIAGFALAAAATWWIYAGERSEAARRPGERLVRFGSGLFTIGLAGLTAAVLLVPTDFQLRMLVGLANIGIMAIIADSAPGRLAAATARIGLLGIVTPLLVLVGNHDVLSNTSAIGLLAFTLVCLSIAYSRDHKEARLLGASLAEQRAVASERATADHLQAALRFMPHGVILTAAGGRVQFLNQRLRDMLGVDAAAFQPGMSWQELLMASTRLNTKTEAGRRGIVERTSGLVGRDHGTTVLRLDDGRVLDCEYTRLEDGSYLTLMRDGTDEAVARETLERDARRCPLTGLGNRRAFEAALDALLADDQPVVLALGDLKAFKAINDSYGHPTGDQVLTQVALRLQAKLPEAFVARLGGDEFAVVAAIGDAAAAAALAVRLHDALHCIADIDGLALETEGRVGYAMAPRDGRDGVDLLRRADLALITARQRPAATVLRFEPALEAAMRAQIREEQAVARVLGEGRVAVAYQPWFRLGDGRAMGVEALARWPQGEAGGLTPEKLVHRAELLGRMASLRQQVMSQALAALADSELEVAINISALEVGHAGFADQIRACAASIGFPLQRLVLEVTETAIHANLRQSAAELALLRAQGVHIAIDDFGSGFSALSSLGQLPVDRLKFDRSLLEPTADGRPSVVLPAALGIGRGLALETIAEGIETVDQLRAVAQLGAAAVQGFLLTPPVMLSDLAPTIAAGGHRLRQLLSEDQMA